MKIIESRYFEFPSINSKMYRGIAVTTKPCSMSTGYRGRGIPSVTRDVPAGTKVTFVLREYGDHKRSWIEIQLDMPSDNFGRVELRATHDMALTLEDAAKKLNINKEVGMKVRNKKTNEIYYAYTQVVDLNGDGKMVHRYIIGVENYQGFHFIEACYSKEDLLDIYEVLSLEPGKYPGWLAESC